MTLLHTKPEAAAQARMVDDGSGNVEVSLMVPTSGLAGTPGLLATLLQRRGQWFCFHLQCCRGIL